MVILGNIKQCAEKGQSIASTVWFKQDNSTDSTWEIAHFAHKAHKPTAGSGQTLFTICLRTNPIHPPTPVKTSHISCRGQSGNEEVLAQEKKQNKSHMSVYVYVQQERTVHSISIVSTFLPLFFSLSLSRCLFFRDGGEERRRAGQSLTKARVSGSV